MEEVQYDGETPVPGVRIPAAFDEKQRLQCLRNKIDSYQPDWISLQFVPFSFDNNGLPWRFAWTMRKLAGSARFEIMFHELWLRYRPVKDLKGRLLGALQKRIILWICRSLRPEVVHTHIPVNRDSLADHGIRVRPLPLFANIGRIDGAVAQGMKKDPGVYRIAFFSRLESPPPVKRALSGIADWCEQKDLALEIALLGGGKSKVTAAAADIQKCVPRSKVLPVGYLTAEGVSAWLSTCDLAVTPIPRHSLGKSGTVAAFLEHSLPVISPVIKIQRDPFFQEQLNGLVLDHFDPLAVAEAKSALRGGNVVAEKLENITKRFVADLELIPSTTTNTPDVNSMSK